MECPYIRDGYHEPITDFSHDFRVYCVCKHCVRYRCVSSWLPEKFWPLSALLRSRKNTFFSRTWTIAVLSKNPNK